MTVLLGWKCPPEPPRYQQPLYLGDQASRKYWAERKPTVEIELIREIDGQRRRIKRRGVLNRANGQTVFIGPYAYHINEILDYRKVEE